MANVTRQQYLISFFLFGLIAVLPAGEEPIRLADLRKANPDHGAYRTALVQRLLNRELAVRDRCMAAAALANLNSEENTWNAQRSAYLNLLATPTLPGELQYILAEGLYASDRKTSLPFSTWLGDPAAAAPNNPIVQELLREIARRLTTDFYTPLDPTHLTIPKLSNTDMKPAIDLAAVRNDADKQLPTVMTADATSKVRAKNWPAARERFLDTLQTYPQYEKASFDGILRTFAQEKQTPKLNDPLATDAFTAYFVEQKCTDNTRIAATLYLANLLFDQNEFDRALAIVATFKATFPESKRQPEADLLIGLCYTRLDQHDKSIPIFEALADNKDIDADIAHKARFFIGWTHLLKQENDAARAAFEKLVQEAPNTDLGKKAQAMLSRLSAPTPPTPEPAPAPAPEAAPPAPPAPAVAPAQPQ